MRPAEHAKEQRTVQHKTAASNVDSAARKVNHYAI
jgi:hypothetical protein